MTAFEVLVVVACVLVVLAMLLSLIPRNQIRSSRGILCASNLRQVSLGFMIWDRDNSNLYPMVVSVTNDGAMELMRTGSLVQCLQCASNEMTAPRIFVCPEDSGCTVTTNWNDLNRAHVSYFIDADPSNEAIPNLVLDGDDNIAIGGNPVASGLTDISSNAPVSWFGTRHQGCGYIGLADGSVDQLSPARLQQTFQETGLATNRIVIP